MIKKEYKHLNETVYIIKLKNGMQVHVLPKDDPCYSTYVELSIPYGALDLDYKLGKEIKKTPFGTAHFLEHKIYAMQDGDAFQGFSRLGVDANAMTSYNQTSYLFTATQNVIPALHHLMHMIDTPYFTEENVDQEKLIIAEELKMYLDDPNTVMQNKIMENMYYKHPMRNDIGGTLESITLINPEILIDIYHNFYGSSNRLITIAGKVDLPEIEKFFKEYDLNHPQKYRKPKTVYPKEFKKLKVKSEIESKKIGIHKLLIGIKLEPVKQKAQLQIKREMAFTMMLNILLGPSSPVFEILLEEKLINQNFSIQSNFEKEAENILIYAESKKIHKLKQILVNLFTKEANIYMNEASFERYKKVYLGQFVYALNNLENKAYLYGKYYHMGSSLFDVVEILKLITYQDVLDTLQSIKASSISTLIHKKA
ncbi:MAG: pitrilysin family protein [Acholeplasmataceae bacterium]|nr:pitrilysin family protein [Acholeplasmataceae bacterium]